MIIYSNNLKYIKTYRSKDNALFYAHSRMHTHIHTYIYTRICIRLKTLCTVHAGFVRIYDSKCEIRDPSPGDCNFAILQGRSDSGCVQITTIVYLL